MQRTNFGLKIFSLIISATLLTACNSVTHGTTGTISEADKNGTQTTGLNDQNSFNDQAAINKMKAPFDQVYYFDYDKDAIHQEDVASINVQANYIISHPNARVRVEGHTDERGSREYNVALGWRRAKAVTAILEQQGVSDKQIVTISFGKEKPIALTHDEAGYSLNRRVNFTYEAK